MSFSIVHLSDLHIGKDDPVFTRTLNNLIEDIKDTTKKQDLRLDAIAFTGDIVEKGGTDKTFEIANEFINRLLSEVNVPKENLLIVPGNHDIPRRLAVSTLLEKLAHEDFTYKDKCDEYWESFGARYKLFNDFLTKTGCLENAYKGMFGGLIKDISTDIGSIRFFLLNSSWSTTGDKDFENLYLGRWQLESLVEIKNKLPKAEYNIALSHHPLEWLNKDEREMILNYIKDKNLLSAETLLHGHIHDGAIDISTNPDGSFVSLVSGIGFPNALDREKGQPKISQCRYAVYNFDLKSQLLNVWLRITREDGNFVNDTMLYKAGGENGHLSIPIKQYVKTETIANKVPLPSNVKVDAVPFLTDWVGRSDELITLLNPSYKVVAITGVGGQGKTWLAAEFSRRHSRGGVNAYFDLGVWVDCRELPVSIHTKIIELLDAITGGQESEILFRDETQEDTVKRFMSHIQNHKLLIVFDNIDAYVNEESETVTNEFKPILDAILNGEHNSKIILTSRKPINDSRGAFRQINLPGLSSDEVIEYFTRRNIELVGDNDRKYCQKLVKLTNGHPYWLGLIAGQILARKDTLKHCISNFGDGETTTRGSIKEYFDTIWGQLNKDSKKLLRHIGEVPRPLTDNQIKRVITDISSTKTGQAIRKLEKLGLLRRHEDSILHTWEYQVHPLVREFLHESYSPSAQRKYVSRVLCIFLHPSLVEKLFSNTEALDKINVSMSANNLADSIETCLNSRNYKEGLELLERYRAVLYDSGYHHKFCSLACQILDLVKWEEFRLVDRNRGAKLLSIVIEKLWLVGDNKRCVEYLDHFSMSVEPDTNQYLGYLSLAAWIEWQQGKFVESIITADECKVLAKKLNSAAWVFNDPFYTRALALRDSGDNEEAVKFFKGRNKSTNNMSSSDLGNIARCYYNLGRHEEAEEFLRQSLVQLLKGNDYISKMNCGYAYLWIAENLFSQKRVFEAKAFLVLAKDIWNTYCPGLLPKTKYVEEKLLQTDYDEPITLLEAHEWEKRFLEVQPSLLMSAKLRK
ncbi:metallophosphoesterase [Desulfosporosinus sp. BG]|uniref:metallophosphoesterase n=1 Tax=Desulfosporosinus sp. BG TaxID=1633135 RepID=UPI00083B0702|nr:metallophosphoesterase [Desulfosporosinus sp. BG]ODA41811.1 protein of unknown function DUF323 [Desulfosporosinus sp. BG]